MWRNGLLSPQRPNAKKANTSEYGEPTKFLVVYGWRI